MITIELSRNQPHYFIKGELPRPVPKVLDEELSYWIEGIEHSKKYKKGKIDGYCHLLRKSKYGDYYFPVGMLHRVKSVLNAYGINYRVSEHSHEVPNLGLTWHGYELRGYQNTAVMKFLENGCRGVISLPTGAGKTAVALSIIHALDCPSLIIVHKTELANQWLKVIREMLDYEAGFIGSGEEEWKNITVGMMQSVVKKGIPEFNLICFDETHRVPSQTAYDIAMACNAPYRLGISATTWRTDGADMKIWAATGEIIYSVTVEDLIDMGYLAKPKFIFLDPPAIGVASRNWQQEYSKGIVRNEGRNQMIADKAIELAGKGLSIYIHVERINHGEILSNMIDCPFISSKSGSKQRRETLKRFEDCETRVLVSTLLGEGVDLPKLDGIILAHGQKTSVGTIQKIGRALRVADGKDNAVIVDFADKGRYLGNHFEERYMTMKKYYGKYFRSWFNFDKY